MEEIVEHIIHITNVDEKGNLLAYKILCNLAVDLVRDGKSKEEVIEYIKHLQTDLNKRKV